VEGESGAVAIVCELRARPGQRDALLRGLFAIQDVARQEEGTDSYIVLESGTEEDLIVLFEVFRDHAAYEVHRAHPVHERLIAELPNLVAGGELKLLRPAGLSRPLRRP
jgi:quinol monooxygenase YgiN